MILTTFDSAELSYGGAEDNTGEWFECDHDVWRYFFFPHELLSRHLDVPKNRPLSLVIHDEPGEDRISIAPFKQGPILDGPRPCYCDWALVLEGKDVQGVSQQCYDVITMLCKRHRKNTLYLEVIYE